MRSALLSPAAGAASSPANHIPSRRLLLLAAAIALLAATGAGQTWTWLSGSNTVDQPGVYGTQGVASPENVPAARAGLVMWADPAANCLWLFGGDLESTGGLYGNGIQMNDLWKYQPATGHWTWMKGSSSPGAAGVYGTQGVANPANMPGARAKPAHCVDSSGTLWMFGGVTSTTLGRTMLNDLWKFDGANWTWVAGSATAPQATVYGSLGVPDPANLPPGGRCGSSLWADEAGNLCDRHLDLDARAEPPARARQLWRQRSSRTLAEWAGIADERCGMDRRHGWAAAVRWLRVRAVHGPNLTCRPLAL
jgi:hypothetical protein